MSGGPSCAITQPDTDSAFLSSADDTSAADGFQADFEVTTDTGITGWGEVYAASVGPRAMVAVIEDEFARHMLGENPEDIEKMFRRWVLTRPRELGSSCAV